MADVRVSVVSVVRDFEMYGNCVAHNPNLAGCGLVPIDNRAENLPVTRRYNAFLDSLSDDRWIVFCHEDWEAGEPLLPLLSGLDPSYLYGPIGVFVEERRRADVIIMRGGVFQCTNIPGDRCPPLSGLLWSTSDRNTHLHASVTQRLWGI